MKLSELTGDEVDWSKNVGKKYTYYEKGSTEKKTVEYEKIDAIYIRLAAKKAESKDTVGVFASDYAIIDVEVVESATTSGGEKQESAKYTISWTEYEHCETTVTYGAGVEVISGVTQLGAGEVVYLMIEPDESYRVEYYVVYGDKAEIVKLTGDKEVFGRDIFSMPEGDVTIMQSVSLND